MCDVIKSMTSQPLDYKCQLQGCQQLGFFANDCKSDFVTVTLFKELLRGNTINIYFQREFEYVFSIAISTPSLKEIEELSI